jgi:hypothetical protein
MRYSELAARAVALTRIQLALRSISMSAILHCMDEHDTSFPGLKHPRLGCNSRLVQTCGRPLQVCWPGWVARGRQPGRLKQAARGRRGLALKKRAMAQILAIMLDKVSLRPLADPLSDLQMPKVRSTENLATMVAPNKFVPKPPGLIGVKERSNRGF